MRRIACFVPVLVGGLVLAGLAHAVTLQILTMDEMAQKSSSIIYARVLDSYGAFQGSMIYTHYRVQVVDSWKGSQNVTEVMLPGGSANGYRQTFAGVPALTQGSEYVMFLWAGSQGAPQLIGLTQGLLAVSSDAKGHLIASRPMTTEQLLDANGKAVRDQAVRMDLNDLKRAVLLALSAGRGQSRCVHWQESLGLWQWPPAPFRRSPLITTTFTTMPQGRRSLRVRSHDVAEPDGQLFRDQ